MHLIPTILCGGSGSRLWPVSRAQHPKPFMRLRDNQSLLQKAFLRGAALPGVKEILTVTNRDLYLKSVEEYKEINSSHVATNYILEPSPRNTAAAITIAALQIQKIYGDEAILLVLAADHLISFQDAFQQAVSNAITMAQQGNLVTFGIEPTIPEIAYGYLKVEGNTVLQFLEKPSFEKAQEYLATGDYLWNSGMFCFTAGTFLAQMQQYCPNILATSKICFESTQTKANCLDLNEETFNLIPEDSIDYALMEKSTQVAVVPCSIGWSDVGSWNAVADLSESDLQGNQIEGRAVLHNVRNCYLQSYTRLISAVGVKDLMIIDTPDALLVADKSCAQDVKQIYAQLKLQDDETHKLHRTVFRPWGTYTVLEEGDCFKIKRIVVNPGASLSLQMHHHRSEHWVVVSGAAVVTNGEKVLTLNVNESTYIPAGNKHRLENNTNTPVTIIEVQSGSYVGEDDIVRFEDVYGRVSA